MTGVPWGHVPSLHQDQHEDQRNLLDDNGDDEDRALEPMLEERQMLASLLEAAAGIEPLPTVPLEPQEGR